MDSLNDPGVRKGDDSLSGLARGRDPAHGPDPDRDRDGSRDRDVALGRGVILSALSLGFSPPTETTVKLLTGEHAASALAAAAAFLDSETGGGLAVRVQALVGFLQRLSGGPHSTDGPFVRNAVGSPACAVTPSPTHGDAPIGASGVPVRSMPGADTPSDAPVQSVADTPLEIEYLSRSYTRLFGHTARGAVSAYETEYGDDTPFQTPHELSDIAGFLRAFGLVLDSRTRERIDHVSCELEFMAFLARKEAYASEIGDEPMHSETRRTSGMFLKDHLGRFAPSFAQRVLKEDPDGFYGALAALCREFVESDCARFGAPIGPSMLRLRTVIEDGAPVACGTDQCPAISCGEGERP